MSGNASEIKIIIDYGKEKTVDESIQNISILNRQK